MGWLERYDTWFILTFRFIYGVRNFASFAMGLARINPLRFAVLNFIAAFVWAILFAGGGYLFGHALETAFGELASHFQFAMLGAFVLAIALLVWVNRRK